MDTILKDEASDRRESKRRRLDYLRTEALVVGATIQATAVTTGALATPPQTSIPKQSGSKLADIVAELAEIIKEL